MPTYSVQVTVNVPSVGTRTFTTVGIVAAAIEAAMTEAKAGITVEVISVQKTA